MPAVYAHYKMGQDVRKALTGREKEIIEKYPELYLIGLHGPDILFYHKALHPDEVSRLGFAMHKRAGTDFFQKAAAIIKKEQNNEAMLSYVYGFMCHFAMDVTCHGYVNEKMTSSGVSHTEIESEFDRELLVRDGKNPVAEKLAQHIVPSEKNADIIRHFFENNGVDKINTKSIRRALKDMVFYCNCLTAPSKLKRFLIYSLMRIAGKYDVMHGLMINLEKNTECDDSTEKLISLYEDSKKLSLKLIKGYNSFLDGEEELDDIYNYNFNSVLIEK